MLLVLLGLALRLLELSHRLHEVARRARGEGAPAHAALHQLAQRARRAQRAAARLEAGGRAGGRGGRFGKLRSSCAGCCRPRLRLSRHRHGAEELGRRAARSKHRDLSALQDLLLPLGHRRLQARGRAARPCRARVCLSHEPVKEKLALRQRARARRVLGPAQHALLGQVQPLSGGEALQRLTAREEHLLLRLQPLLPQRVGAAVCGRVARLARSARRRERGVRRRVGSGGQTRRGGTRATGHVVLGRLLAPRLARALERQVLLGPLLSLHELTNAQGHHARRAALRSPRPQRERLPASGLGSHGDTCAGAGGCCFGAVEAIDRRWQLLLLWPLRTPRGGCRCWP